MLKNSNIFSKLKSKWKKEWRNKVIDIILFGSALKGKSNPNDIDICILFRQDVDLILIKEIQSIVGEHFHVSALSIDNFFTDIHSLAKTILFEGKSLITHKKISENFDLGSFVLYSYDLSKEKPTKKVRFVYIIRGRNGEEGIVKKSDGEFISNNSFMVPVEKDSEIQEIFSSWNIKYKRKKIMLMH